MNSHTIRSIILCLLFFVSISQFAQTKPFLSASLPQVNYPNTDKPYLNIVPGSGRSSYVSGVLDDDTDPAKLTGILFKVSVKSKTFQIVSSNMSVVPAENVTMTYQGDDVFVLKIKPVSAGYADISIRADNGVLSEPYVIHYAASKSQDRMNKSIYPVGMADASAVVAVGDDYMFVADDESNEIHLFHRSRSGKALSKVDISAKAAGVGDEEFDLEGACPSSLPYNSGKRVYWIGSLANGKSGKEKPYRDRLIATDIIGDGATATLAVRSYSAQMRAALIAWGDANAWNFSYSSQLIPKRIEGFNVEALALSAQGNKAYVGFRAPCVPLKGEQPTASNRKYALLAPIANLEQMLNVAGKSKIKPLIEEPILFDLGGLGIRDLLKIDGEGYLLLAGPAKSGGVPMLYFWDGKAPANSGVKPIVQGESLVKLALDLSPLVQRGSEGKAEGFPEAMLCKRDGKKLSIQVLCDDGTVEYYKDGVEAKSLEHAEHKKFQVVNYVFQLP